MEKDITTITVTLITEPPGKYGKRDVIQGGATPSFTPKRYYNYQGIRVSKISGGETDIGEAVRECGHTSWLALSHTRFLFTWRHWCGRAGFRNHCPDTRLG